MSNTHLLHLPFDLETHKANFINYLEVVILEDGTVEYAVPSHQEKAIRIGMEKTGQDRDTFYNSCPPEYYFDVMKWLSMVTGVVFVWNDGIMGTPNLNQCKKLNELHEAGVYHGPVMPEEGLR